MAIELSEAPQIAAAPAQSWKQLASRIDHTLLKPDATRQEVEKLCADAVECGFHCVMLNSANVAVAAACLQGTPVCVGAVVGFPLGATTVNVKRFESQEVLRLGAREIDMVMNIGALKSGDRARVEAEMRSLVEVAHDAGAILKITLEMALLNLEEKLLACQLAAVTATDYVKTGTGFAPAGATAADVALLRGIVGEKLGVKASGGIRTLEDARMMLDAGANRLGTSAGVEIIAQARK